MKASRRIRRESRRLFRACLVDGSLDEARVRRAVGRVARSRRRGTLALLSQLHRLVRQEQARHRAVVESAVALSTEARAGVEAGIARAYGPGLLLSFAENPDLIAGMRIQVNSDVYDGSVRAALSALEARFR
jgi:F-type H+-transporting ATPase subunit delta